MTTHDLTTLRAAAAEIFVAAGVERAAAEDVADALVEADARGIASHGLMLVPMYVDRLLAGSVSTSTRPVVLVDKGAMALLDAEHALGIVTSDVAMAMAVEKAGRLGIGIVNVRHAFHFGGAFRYVQAAMDAGMIGIAASNTRPLMPAPGGATAVVGNNPIAVGVPGADPILVDMALSEAALGKIRLADSEGRAIPDTWATDSSGQPTTDPAAAIAGLLLPAGGPKGYGLALVVDVLTGVLGGGGFGSSVRGLYADTTVPNDCAHLFIAVDPEFWDTPDAFADRVSALGREVHASEVAPGVDAVLLPGQRERESARRAHAQGITIPVSVIEALVETAQRVGASLPPGLLPAGSPA